MKKILLCILGFFFENVWSQNIVVHAPDVDESASSLMGSHEIELLVNSVFNEAKGAFSDEENIAVVWKGSGEENIEDQYSVESQIGTFGASVTLNVVVFDRERDKKISSFYCDGKTVGDLNREIKKKAPAMFVVVKRYAAQPHEGYLILNVSSLEDFGDRDDLRIYVDGEDSDTGKLALKSGSHSVLITSQCYENENFDVLIADDKTVNKDIVLTPRVGRLILNVLYNGRPVAKPVYANQFRQGETPFEGVVSVCSQIIVGDDDNLETIPVVLAENETVEYTHVLDVRAEESEEVVVEGIEEEAGGNSSDYEDKEPVAYQDVPKLFPPDYEEYEEVGSDVEPTTFKSGSFMSSCIWVSVFGGGLAIVGDRLAAYKHDQEPENKEKYEEARKEIRAYQTMRTVGLIIGAVGLLGFGLSFLF